MKRLGWVFLFAVLTLAMGGCVDYQQRLSLHGDGSGTVSVRMKAPRGANWETEDGLRLVGGGEEELCAQLRQKYAGLHVRVQSCEVDTVGDREKTAFTLFFEDLEDLNSLELPFSPAGLCSFQVREKRGIEVKQIIELDGDVDWDADSDFGQWLRERLSENLLSKFHFRFEVAFPRRVTDTNADWVRGNRVAVWRFTLADVLDRDRVVLYARGD